MDSFILSQLLVGAALIFDIISFQRKKRREMLLCFIVACVFIASHFWVLEQYTAASMYAISCVRFAISYFSTSKRWLFIFIPLCFITTAINYTEYVNLLALSAALLISIASFCKDDKSMRLLIMASTSIWIIHNSIVFTPMGILLESIFLLSNFTGYYRFYLRKPLSSDISPKKASVE